MPNKRSEGGQRNRDLIGEELASFLADLGQLAADLGVARDRSDQPAAEPATVPAGVDSPEEEAFPAVEVASEPTAGDASPGAGEPRGISPDLVGAPPLDVIEELPSVSPSYLPPLSPEDGIAGEGDGAATADSLPAPVPDLELGEIASTPPALAPLVPGGLPVLVSRRPWSLAAAMEPLEPLSPPPPRPVLVPRPEMAAALRPEPDGARRLRLPLHFPLLPTVVLAMLGVVIVLLVLRLMNA
jgi:hypothetical protein